MTQIEIFLLGFGAGVAFVACLWSAWFRGVAFTMSRRDKNMPNPYAHEGETKLRGNL